MPATSAPRSIDKEFVFKFPSTLALLETLRVFAATSPFTSPPKVTLSAIKLPSKILLSCKKGIGKSLLVKHFLFKVLEEANSRLLIENETHANILHIKKKPDKKSIEIEQVREIIKFTNS